MGVSLDVDLPSIVKNRTIFFHKLGINPEQAVRAQLMHGSRVVAISRMPKKNIIPRCDALVTDRPGVFLYILTADCFPVFFYDAAGRAVGIAHAGWRGIMGKIVLKVARVLRKQYGVHPVNLKVVIGPGIQKCHFEIWPDTRHRGTRRYLPLYRRYLHKKGKRIFLDLESIITYQLHQSGVPAGNIRSAGECTYHLPRKYFSFRRDESPKHPRGFGEMVSVIGIKNKTDKCMTA